ncbi:growth hormone-regulated TBC protein 1-A-like [Onthophagus taurus]|uniref:growth hormone-regulated TBC protein 1-A-like n=1 Tax=Onthophagus taurus TaxID=166361 RepID=UPI000C209917|nr:growth hormone-regulated TBC protein 1-A-like [Onthophagus taurus]
MRQLRNWAKIGRVYKINHKSYLFSIFPLIYTVMGQSRVVNATEMYNKYDDYGFPVPRHYDYELHKKYLSKIKRRQQEWNELNDRNKYKRGCRLKRRIRKGIPWNERSTTWMILSGAQALKNKSTRSYEELKAVINNTDVIKQLEKDVLRLFRENIFFMKEGVMQKRVFNICGAFANQNAEINYCQGLDRIAALLLLSTKDEEISFWLYKALIENILPNYFGGGLSGLLTEIAVFLDLLRSKEPSLYQHFNDLGLNLHSKLSHWFLCSYSGILPAETVLRIWDCLFYEGSVVLMRVALTLIRMHKNQLLQVNNAEELVKCLQDIEQHPQVYDCNYFIKLIYNISGSLTNKQLIKLRIKHINAIEEMCKY